MDKLCLVSFWTSVYFLSLTAADHVNLQRDKRNEVVNIEVRLDRSNASVDSLFLSVGLPHIVSKFDYFTFDNFYTRHLCRQLSPMSVRILCRPLFPPYLGQQIVNGKPFPNQDMSVSTWQRLFNFMRSVDWRVSMNFANLDRRPNNDWNDDNARAFLDYAEKNQIPIPDFQLGNEPNSYVRVLNMTYSTQWAAKDFQKFRKLVHSYPMYMASSILGPECSQPTASGPYISSYYVNFAYHKPTYRHFINTTGMDELKINLIRNRQYMKENNCTKPVSITETSSVSGGGLPGVADRFVAGFLWLDKLGVSSLYGVKRLYRFNLWSKTYSLISPWPLKPLPDYFLSVLFKRLVEGPVLEVQGNPPHLRAYANCAKSTASKSGAVVIYLLNVRDSPVTVSLKQFTNHKVDTYFFTPGTDGDLHSTSVKVSDVPMTFNGEGSLTFTPITVTGRQVQMPGHSYGFVLVPDANAELCRTLRLNFVISAP
ncbi:hypothetical protein Btru_007185 [Bulinus truncatus]|nr:hypothetical protein Btru_007185 [Bulinus truncatus]